jgi:hypothetical protein
MWTRRVRGAGSSAFAGCKNWQQMSMHRGQSQAGDRGTIFLREATRQNGSFADDELMPPISIKQPKPAMIAPSARI